MTYLVRVLSFLLVVVLGAATVSSAVLDPLERSCQKTMGKESSKYGKAVTKCTAKCQKSTPQDPACLYEGATVTTCREAAWTKAQGKIPGNCLTLPMDDTDSCPECYEAETFTGIDPAVTCDNFAVGLRDWIGAKASLADTLLWCDDSAVGPENLLNPDEAKCRTKTAAALGAFIGKNYGCLVACGKRKDKGLATGDCDPIAAATTGGTADDALEVCIQAAMGQFTGKAEKACTDTPDCWGQSPAGEVSILGAGVRETAESVANCSE